MDADDEVQLFARPKKKAKAAAHPQKAAIGGAVAVKRRHKELSASAQEDTVASGGDVHGGAPDAAAAEAAERSGGQASSSNPDGDSDVTDFKGLGLSEWLCGVCASLGMRTPTEVQRGCVPAVLAGRDVIGLAQTGSGKTAAFALPILQTLARDPYGVFAVVLTPTRCVQQQWAAIPLPWEQAGSMCGTR
jgi:ATP-dependent RNA helicase DDX49/DBP8